MLVAATVLYVLGLVTVPAFFVDSGEHPITILVTGILWPLWGLGLALRWAYRCNAEVAPFSVLRDAWRIRPNRGGAESKREAGPYR